MSQDVWFVVTRQDAFQATPLWREVASQEEAEAQLARSSSRWGIAFRINEVFLDPPVGVVESIPRRRRRSAQNG